MITGIQFRNAIISGANNLGNQKQVVNDLNVFPVPDGDTGTNMSMTISSAVQVLQSMTIDESTGIDEISAAVSSALLRGARGNSGVILSLLFRGFSNGCADKNTINAKELAAAFNMGVDAAYKAVLKPTEGTVLTVSRMAARAAKRAAANGATAIEVLDAAYEQGKITLDETPDMLPILKKAGVVDAGGKGYLIILEGMIECIKTGVIMEADQSVQFTDDGVADPVPLSEDEITFTYCTEFIVGKEPSINKDPGLLRRFLNTLGDSIVMVDDNDIIKVHVHTDHPGKVFEEALTYGMLEKTKVENMRLQFRKRQADGCDINHNEHKNKIASPEKEFGVVAIAAGEGLVEVFKDIGCDNIVFGGQTMNPSTDDIFEACLKTPAKTVFVLPNNKNIIMAAEQAVPLAEDRKIVVIPTKTIPQGISAALSFDTSSSESNIFDTMRQAAQNVRTGQITFAARDSDFDGNEIKEGQILALNEGKLEFVGEDINASAFELTLNLIGDNADIITLYYGEDISSDMADELASAIKAERPEVDISIIYGGQPIYSYIISVE